VRRQKREDRKKRKQVFFYRQRGKHSEFRESRKGGVLALLALSGIKFTPYGEQCVREWR
jgi:hypothetical protein